MSVDIRERVNDFIEEYGQHKVRALLDRLAPQTPDQFIERLYTDLHDAIDALERIAHQVQGASENSLRTRLLMSLRANGYDARAESDERGHCDLLVQCGHLGLVWIAEAKKHNEYDWLAKGLAQLHTRYTTGRHRDMALLVFAFNKDVKSVMDEWKERLIANRYCGLEEGSCEDGAPGKLWFSSRHVHSVSGLTVTTRHVFAALNFAPADNA